jgi:4-hydroxy-3-methylbut-2-en-1-yl diphosphate reductase
MVEDKRNWPDIVVGKPGGCCGGVERAVNAYEDFHPQFSVGEPAHNPVLINRFKQEGVVFVNNISQVPKGATVAFGPHGHTAEDVAIAKERASAVLLTECPYVTSVKSEITANTENGIVTIYYGQKDKQGNLHPETRAALSAGNAILVTSLEEALAVGVEDPEKVGFACQTTHNADSVMLMAEELKKKYPKLKMREKTDLCPATKNRQLAAGSIHTDITIIVGDWQTSSNTRSLADKALDKGGRVFTVNTRDELKQEDFYNSHVVGIVGSASATPEQIDGVVNFFTERGSVKEDVVVAEEKQNFQPAKVYKPD